LSWGTVSGNRTHHEPSHFGRAAAFEMLFQSTRSCGTIKSVQKRQMSTNLFGHCDIVESVERGVPKTRRLLSADNSRIGKLILSHTKVNYIAVRDLP
jgi:hypothetical protein